MTAPDGTLDGGIDEQDRDQTEVQLALAVATLLAAKTVTAPWSELVTARLSGMLRAYLQRAALDMARNAGLDPGEATQAASDAVAAVIGDVEQHTAAWLKIAAEDRRPKGGGPMSGDDAREAAGIIARTLATYAREVVREHVALTLGSLYKTWVTRQDDRVRPGHVTLQGKTKRIGRPFVTEGHDIRYPGDPRAPLHLTAGCRCHLAYSKNPIKTRRP